MLKTKSLIAAPETDDVSTAKRLHAMLRCKPGYKLVVDSPLKVNWTIQTLVVVAEDGLDLLQELPQGCIGAV